MKKDVFFPFLRRFFVRTIMAALFAALLLRAAELYPAVEKWVFSQLHTSLDISYFLK